MADIQTTRRRFLQACLAAGAAAFIPGIGLISRDGHVDEPAARPDSYTMEWQVRAHGGEWETVGYGETLIVPDLPLGAYDLRVVVSSPNVIQQGEPTPLTVLQLPDRRT